MRFRIDLAAKYLFWASHRQRGHLLPQLFARALRPLPDIGLGRGILAIALALGSGLRLFDHLSRPHFGLGEDLGGAVAALLDGLLGLTRRDLERFLALLGGGNPVGDRLLPLLDR